MQRIQFLIGGICTIYVLNILMIMAFSIATVYIQPYWDTFHEISPFLFPALLNSSYNKEATVVLPLVPVIPTSCNLLDGLS